MTDLPEGWEWKTIGDVATLSLGKMLDKKQATGLHPTPYLRNINVRWGSFDLDNLGSMDIRPEELPRVTAVAGDVVVCEGGEPGRAAVWRGPEPAALQKALHRVRPNGEVIATFIVQWLWHLAQGRRLEAHFTGTTIKHLPKEQLLNVPIPVPPLDEQERIVATIEEHLSRVDAAAGSLASAGRRSHLLAGRVVDCAVEGEAVSLGSLLREPLRNGVSARASATGTVRVVTLTAVTRSEFSETNTKLIDQGDRSLGDLWMEPGDIFVERSNTPDLVGTAAMFRGERGWAIFPDLLIRVRTDDRVEPDYLELVLQSEPVRRYYRRSAQGIAGSMPKISQPIVEATPISLPSRQRQRELVLQAHESLDGAARLTTGVVTARRRAEQLRRSILAAAFDGRLV